MKLKQHIMMDVVNDGSIFLDMPSEDMNRDNVLQVWTVYDFKRFEEVGLVHNDGSFKEDKWHDWAISPDDKLRFYSHSGKRGDKHDIVIVYEDWTKKSKP